MLKRIATLTGIIAVTAIVLTVIGLNPKVTSLVCTGMAVPFLDA